MFATRHGTLEVRTSAQMVVMSGSTFGFNLLLSVANVGRLPVRAPYLKVSPGIGWHAVGVGLLDMRQLRNNTTGFYAKTDQLVHVVDEFQIAYRGTGLELLMLGDRRQIISQIRETRDGELFRIRGFQEQVSCDRLFGAFQVSFGAENALPKTETFDLSKWDMFEIMEQHLPR